jgi:hypothetical protein
MCKTNANENKKKVIRRAFLPLSRALGKSSVHATAVEKHPEMDAVASPAVQPRHNFIYTDDTSM